MLALQPVFNPFGNPMPSSFSTARVLIIMGVSGCGKSTLAASLASRFGFTYVEADDYHTGEAKALMASGTPLTDAQREPWIQALQAKLIALTCEGQSVVMAYSGLRAAHRERFRTLGLPLQFFHLMGDKALIRYRMQSRQHHFMPSALLDSQYTALDSTEHEADVITISIDQPVAAIIQQAETLAAEFINQPL
jgi:gluconokinase